MKQEKITITLKNASRYCPLLFDTTPLSTCDTCDYKKEESCIYKEREETNKP